MSNDYSSAILNNDLSEALKAFLFNYTDSFEAKDCESDTADRMLDYIRQISIAEIIDFVDENDSCIGELDPTNIPQFSDINYIDTILNTVKTNPDGDFELFGYYYKKDAKEGAHRKYGENHYKTASLLGLVTRKRPFVVTKLGECYMKMTEKDRLDLRPKLYMRIPIIQRVMADSNYGNAFPTALMRTCLSESTVIRRRSNVKTLISEICAQCDDSLNLLDRFKWE